MLYKVIYVSFIWIAISKAVPADYVFETWPKQNPDSGSCRVASRSGLEADEHSKTNTETADTEEATEEDDQNGLLNNFWAVDNLPMQSGYVSIKKLPDVYLDEHDLPSPISDMMTVERSEITEEAKDLQSPEFGETPLYDASMQPLDNIGKRDYQQYRNYIPYPQLPSDSQMYDNSYYYFDNNTMYPIEKEMGSCPANSTDTDILLGEPHEHISTESSVDTPKRQNPPCPTSKPEKPKEKVEETDVSHNQKEITTLPSVPTTKSKILTKNSTYYVTEETTTPKCKKQVLRNSGAAEKKVENVMKISACKKEGKKESS